MENKFDINSKQYWDRRFENDWESNSGREQTMFFANIAIENIPSWLIADINNNKLNICDVGCAEGDSIPIINNKFYKSEVIGLDFSEHAINKAKSYYPHYKFQCSAIEEIEESFDVIFSSNVLEHFSNPFNILENILSKTRKHLILLLPFQEYKRFKEHFFTFDYEHFPLMLNNFSMTFYKEIDCSKYPNRMWSLKQILVVYTNTEYANQLNISLDSFTTTIVELEKENNELKYQIDEIRKQNHHLQDSHKKLEEIKIKLPEEHNREKSKILQEIIDLQEEKALLLSEMKSLKYIINQQTEEKKLIEDSILELNHLNQYSQDQLKIRESELNSIYNSKLWKAVGQYYKVANKRVFLYPRKAIRMVKQRGIKYTSNIIKRKLRNKQNTYSIEPIKKNIKIVENGTGIICEKTKQVYIFSGVAYYDIGGGQRSAQLAKTFDKMGYEVHYIYAFDSFEEDRPKNINILTYKHKNIKDYSINELIRGLKKDPIFIFEIPHKDFEQYLSVGKNVGAKIVYEHIDNWETNLGELFYNVNSFNNFLIASDLIVATSEPLKDQISNYLLANGLDELLMKVEYIANAFDTELFDPLFISNEKPKDLILGEKTLVYYGSLWGNWFDWSIIKYIAVRFPNYSINLIGDYKPIQDKISKLPKNIHFLGLKPQTDLPLYTKYSDICLLPFKNDEIGKYVSPLKIFEYIAMEKPVLSTALPDIIGYPNVFCADTKEAWAELLNSNVVKTEKDVNNFVLQNNWYARISNILTPIINRKEYESISVIILNRNNKSVILKCIDSLLNYKEQYNYEIIIVDNQSTDGSFELLSELYGEQVKLIKNQKNGCSSGRNLGVKHANGSILCFLDSDQWAISDYWLDSALDILDTKPSIGAVGWAGGWFEKDSVAGPITDYLPNRGISSAELYRTDLAYLGTGGLVMRKNLFELIDGFDEKYDPTCYEDTDLSLKIRNQGYELAYCPYINIKHLPHQTTNSGSKSHEQLMKRNGEYFMGKWGQQNPRLLEYYFND